MIALAQPDAEPGRRRWVRVLLWSVGVLAVVVAGTVAWWVLSFPDADAAALAEVGDRQDLEVVALDGVGGVALHPADGRSDEAVIFYPGAAVPPEAYLPVWAPVVADTGVSVFVPEMPLRLAVLGRSRADAVIEANPEVATWWLGGHSLGGAMAGSYAGAQPPDELRGLILWGAYVTEGADLRARDDLTVLSVSGSRDGLSTPQDIAERRELLPADARMEELAGVNHAQFGRYGPQSGDGTPTVTDDRATRLIADAVSALLVGED